MNTNNFTAKDVHIQYLAYVCRYCSGNHPPEQCPRIKRIAYYENGTIRAVEFKDGGDEWASMDDMLATMTTTHSSTATDSWWDNQLSSLTKGA